MFNQKFLIDTAERAIKTFAQTMVVLITSIVAGNGTLNDVNWAQALSMSALAAILSVLTSIVSSQVNSKDSASLVE